MLCRTLLLACSRAKAAASDAQLAVESAEAEATRMAALLAETRKELNGRRADCNTLQARMEAAEMVSVPPFKDLRDVGGAYSTKAGPHVACTSRASPFRARIFTAV